ncbi:tyrosine-type recombinase/integrase [Cellulophaga tyrosinoxydans]|uniref:Phage integrase family n=1 Tax=Cellulophaga tyrosinoxydans TaxID=504486 RepID=A0A1W1YC39_9FLAO|nr:phage integrase SAM-like domain-containing protein [Cellulophaga tyrosinoxydans]SMC33715.1 Phage integrase family [Cellulophaga tyrosinoxydans]
MATIKLQLIGKAENVPIYLRLSVNRNLTPRAKTGLFINPKDWSSTTGLPKQTTSANKNLSTDLQNLKIYIFKKFNDASSEGVEISKDWLQHNIDVFFSRKNEENLSELLTDAIQSIIDEVATRKNAKGGLGLSKSRKDAYISLKNVLIEYQKEKRYKVKDVNLKFGKDFLKYLLHTKKYQKSTALKKLADLKTVCNDAELNGIEANIQYKKIESSKPNNENIIYLTPLELEKIQKAELINEAHQNARKWLLLGCNLGQRGGDLLQLNETNFVKRNGLEVIELKQQKTGKNVTIPVLETTKEIIASGLPYKISIQKFNKYIKVICKKAELNDMIKGSKIQVTVKGQGNKKKRKIDGVYPKWELMASHVCRRSFASNLYGILPTPLIMQITQHSSERLLLNYIGKNTLDYAQQIADFYTLQALKDKKEPQLTVLKNVINQ